MDARRSAIDLAVEAARRAFASWSATPVPERARVLFRYRELLEEQFEYLGVNVGVPAPMALFSFSGWDQSFFGDLHVQGTEGILFYTRQKTVLWRWP